MAERVAPVTPPVPYQIPCGGHEEHQPHECVGEHRHLIRHAEGQQPNRQAAECQEAQQSCNGNRQPRVPLTSVLGPPASIALAGLTGVLVFIAYIHVSLHSGTPLDSGSVPAATSDSVKTIWRENESGRNRNPASLLNKATENQLRPHFPALQPGPSDVLQWNEA